MRRVVVSVGSVVVLFVALFIASSGSARTEATGSAGSQAKIAFSGWRPADGNYEVYVMNADGSDQQNLTRNPGADVGAVWSPDGLTIAFVSLRDGGKVGNREIYVMNADGSDQRRLTRNKVDENGPAWSPDGQKIAFTWDPFGNGSEVYVMNADGSGKQSLTRTKKADRSPAWSPDGRRIAFNSRRNGNWDVYVMNADGSDQRRLTRNKADDYGPAWSPDGRRIAYGGGAGGCIRSGRLGDECRRQ